MKERIGAGRDGPPPSNFKASVADGRVLRWSAVRWDGTQWCLSYFSPERHPLRVLNVGYGSNDETPRPDSLVEMTASAAAIAGDPDFLRVDLHEVDGEIWLGETTAHPNGELVALEPSSIDLEWGRL